MKLFLNFFLQISFPLLSLTHGSQDNIHSPTVAFSIVDSSFFEVPFTALETPAIVMQIKNDSFYLLNSHGAEFYILDRKGTVTKQIVFNKFLPYKYHNYTPLNFYLSKSYYVFMDGNIHPLFMDKAFKVGGYFWCNSFRDHYYFNPDFKFFFSEKNQTLYYSCYHGIQDTDTIISLTHDYYAKNIVGTFKIPFLKSEDSSVTHADTNLLQRLINGNYIIHHSGVYLSDKGFLPYLNYKDISLDEVKNEMLIGEAADSNIGVYDPEGNLLRTFGRKGNHIEPADSFRYMRSFNRHAYPKHAYGFIIDSLQYRCPYYTSLAGNADLQLWGRVYLDPDSSKIVSGKDVGYRSSAMWTSSSIKRRHYVQLYDHEKFIGEFTMPEKWVFIGFAGKNLVFYKMIHVENSQRYQLHIYYVAWV